MTTSFDKQNPRHQLILFLLVCAVALAITVGHTRFLDFKADPRILVQPWLLQNGFVQYVHIADEHAPLLPEALAWISPLFAGDMLLTARVTHAVLISLTVVLVMVWVANRGGLWSALASGAFLWGWSIFFGFRVLWHNLALSPLYFLFYIALVHPWRNQGAKAFALGFLAGTAILLKQHALLLVPVYLLWLVWQKSEEAHSWSTVARLLATNVLGILAPILFYLIYNLAEGGTLSAFLYWNLVFNLQSNYRELGRLLPRYYDIAQIAPAFLLLPPFLASLFRRAPHATAVRERVFLLLLFLMALVFQYPRYSLPHWAVAFPFVAALSGLVCGDLLRKDRKGSEWLALYAAFVLLWLLQGAAAYWPYWQGEQSQKIIRYEELEPLVPLLETHLPADKDIVIVPNNEAVDNLYYLLQRRPPHYWVMHYPWFANARTTGEWLAAMETEQPEQLILFEKFSSMLNEWPEIRAYVQENYVTVDTIMWEESPIRVMERQ